MTLLDHLNELRKRAFISCASVLLASLIGFYIYPQTVAFLISPFVGRILDWFKANTSNEYNSENDPGVESVAKIFNYFKKYNYKTVVMAASFRNKDEILNLAGCDKLTISPALLDELNQMSGEIDVKLNASEANKLDLERINVNESSFRWHLNENQMASFKLAEGIRLFNKDMLKLKNLIQKQL